VRFGRSREDSGAIVAGAAVEGDATTGQATGADRKARRRRRVLSRAGWFATNSNVECRGTLSMSIPSRRDACNPTYSCCLHSTRLVRDSPVLDSWVER
jgi:hypothetical protein